MGQEVVQRGRRNLIKIFTWPKRKQSRTRSQLQSPARQSITESYGYKTEDYGYKTEGFGYKTGGSGLSLYPTNAHFAKEHAALSPRQA